MKDKVYNTWCDFFKNNCDELLVDGNVSCGGKILIRLSCGSCVLSFHLQKDGHLPELVIVNPVVALEKRKILLDHTLITQSPDVVWEKVCGKVSDILTNG